MRLSSLERVARVRYSSVESLPAYPVLAIDVGAGTQDILLYDPELPPESCAKLVLPSQPVIVGRRIARATAEREDVFLCGNPSMIDETVKLLEEKGFKEWSKHEPGGQVHLEKYW